MKTVGRTFNTGEVQKGFLKALDRAILGYADFRGNMQYISVGNINSTQKASLFLMDYPGAAAIKDLGRIGSDRCRREPGVIGEIAGPGLRGAYRADDHI